MSDLITIQNVRAFIDKNGIAQLHQEDVARGLGFVERKSDGIEYIRWGRFNTYLSEFGFATSGENEFIPENIFYRLAMKANNETAIAFQEKIANEVLPSIRRTGGYIGNDEMFINTYLPFADDTTRFLFKGTLETVRQQNELIKSQRKEIQHKEDVIIALVDQVTLAEKRQVLNRVVRYKNANFQERWKELYRQFEMKYHIGSLKERFNDYNEDHKPKMKNVLDYVDRVMGKVPEIYEIACKLYENDIKELTDKLYRISA